MPRYMPRRSFRRYARKVNRKYKRFIRRKKADPFKRASKKTNKLANKMKHQPIARIQRLFVSNTVTRRISTLNIFEVNMTQWTTAGGRVEFDYKISNFMTPQEFNYYKARFALFQLSSTVMTFYIDTTNNLTQTNDIGSVANLAQTQVTDPYNFPNLYARSFNNSIQQSSAASLALTDSNNNLMRVLEGINFGKLNYHTKYVQKYHLPSGYRGVFTTWPVDSNVTLDTALAGPVYNEPHGVVFLWPTFNNYTNNVSIKLKIGMRCDTFWTFKDRLINIP